MPTPWKIVVSASALLLAVALGSGTERQAASADAEIDVSLFYSTLAPHGEWIQVQSYGWAWVPENTDYGWRPYTVGSWAWVEPYGWTWISDEPWGWATYHYGRWIYVEDYGWAWLPGTVWAPAWVVFRYGDPWVGWAPRPPEAGWRYDAAPDVAALNVGVNVGWYAWSFVQLGYFAEPGLQTHIVGTAYNDYLVRGTQWSTRYAPVSGSIANQSIDVAAVEKAREAPVPRRRLKEATAPEKGSGTRVEGDDVVLYRPRIAAKPPANPPVVKARGVGPAGQGQDLEAWTAQRRAALKAHLEAQKTALESQDAVPVAPREVKPGTLPGQAEDAAQRREAYRKALEAEQKRLEDLLERQRKRREQLLQSPQQPPQQPAPGSQGQGQGNPGMGNGSGKDRDKEKEKEKEHGKK